MNGNPYTSSWIGATAQYPIYEYANLLDSNQSNFVTNTSNILEIHSAISSNNLQTQIQATCNLIYKDADRNTIVKISAQNPQYPLIGNPIEMQFQNVNGSYLTKIIQTGELYVYHPSTPLPAGYGPGWWGVENKIANCITDGQGLRFDVTNLQAATGAAAISDATTATAAATGAASGLAAAGGATAAAGAAIGGGDYSTLALGAAGGALFSVLGYLSYQAQISSNLTSNGFSNQAALIQSNINSAKVLITDNISNICIAKGFINCNIKTPQFISKLNNSNLNTYGITLNGTNINNIFLAQNGGSLYDTLAFQKSSSGQPTPGYFDGIGGRIVWQPSTTTNDFACATGVNVATKSLWNNVSSGYSYDWYFSNVPMMSLNSNYLNYSNGVINCKDINISGSSIPSISQSTILYNTPNYLCDSE